MEVDALMECLSLLALQSEYHNRCIMSSCVKPLIQREEATPVVLLHSFDRFVAPFIFVQLLYVFYIVLLVFLFKLFVRSSLLEWRCAYPLLESAGLEAWAVDILGWGFSNLGF